MPLDVGVGLILGVFLNMLSGFNYPLCLLIGVVACLLPDLDFIWQVLSGKYSSTSVHRDGLHYPLLFTPAVGILGLLINPYIGAVFAAGAFIHFVHDSIGLGWGVKWLFPFKNVSYAFLCRAGLPTEKDMLRKLFYHWTDQERDEGLAKYADPQWIQHIYFRFNIFGAVEYLVLAIGAIVAVVYS